MPTPSPGSCRPGQDILRPAIEDWFGAAAVISALEAHGAGPLSPEAVAAKSCHDGLADIAALIADCASGRELAAIGFADDVAVASEIDSSTAVPLLVDGAFIGASL
ncbi:2-phosphosulfolactate phosphatase [Nocardia sp. IFM 10818]